MSGWSSIRKLPYKTSYGQTTKSWKLFTSNGANLKSLFGKFSDGSNIYRYTLRNSSGMEVDLINYGAILSSIRVPDKNGIFDDILLGYDDFEGYLKDNYYMGALVGRYANRIAGGVLPIGGRTYQLNTNNGGNHLHGGPKGFSKVCWDEIEVKENNSITFGYISDDLEENYPGRLSIRVKYSLGEDNCLDINISAETNKSTVINITTHPYINLGGVKNANILKHMLQIEADQFLPINDSMIPTGEYRTVDNSPFDFKSIHAIEDSIGEQDSQLVLAGGYDHNFVIRDYDGSLRKAARLIEPVSGRTLEVFTSTPGLHFYSANFLDDDILGKDNEAHGYRKALCLEPQFFPDSPNHSEFPSTNLEPGEKHKQHFKFKFGITN